MNAYLQLSPENQRAACREGGARRLLPAASMEKDFWVCWTLRELFALPEIGSRLTFKGGTSLSKCYGLIERFSEDIDLVIDRTTFGVEPPDEPGISKGETRRRLESLKAACGAYVQTTLKPALASRLTATMPMGRPWTLTEEVSVDGGINLLFAYPSVFDAGTGPNPIVKIEPGARSDIEPNRAPEIQPYLAEVLPDLLGPSRFAVRTVAPERTFWEKAMLLHEENFPAEPAEPKPALARHYYDLYCLLKAGVGTKATADVALFANVDAHRSVFFRQSKAIEEARKPGTFRLLPAAAHLNVWRANYDRMKEPYFFGEPPTFDQILRVVGEFEQQFNQPTKG
jgi:hypothetical protein